MATIKVHAGDFLECDGSFNELFGWEYFRLKTRKRYFMGERISTDELDTVALATEENVKKIGGTIGWGVAGGIIFGPAGLLAGLLLGGKKKEITFIAKFKDGRKLLGTTDSKTFTKLQAAVF